jgi:histidinol-phosphate/aromatic aminotransferase/cobyric acid decarboxylase-like protein
VASHSRAAARYQFTEPEAPLAAAGVPFQHVVLGPPFALLANACVPDEADLVVVGNPATPRPASLAELRAELVAGLTSIGLDVVDGCAPFVLFTVPDAQLMRKHLDGKGIAVRRCDTFVGLDGEYLRAAVRTDWPVLVQAIGEVLR